MLFTRYILGFVTITSALPSPHPVYTVDLAARDESTPAMRGLTWSPKRHTASKQTTNSNQALNNNSSSLSSSLSPSISAAQAITILQLEQNLLAATLLATEIQLADAIRQEIQLKREFQSAIDNIRLNTFRNQNSATVETIIVVVTEIVDNRSNNNQKRYISRQIGNNNNNNQNTQTVFITVVEATQIVINSNSNNNNSQNNANSQKQNNSNNKATQTGTAAAPAGTGNASPSLGTYVPGAAIAQDASIKLYPAGSASPGFSNSKQSDDPASIILDGSTLFVATQHGSFDR